MITARKIGRELLRVLSPRHFWQQGKYWATVLWARIVKTPKFLNVSNHLPAFGSADHLIGFVVYAPGGIREDTRASLRALQQLDGVKILILMNHRPTASDQEFLAETNLSYAARENSGYDFGAYRDLVLSLGAVHPRRLTLMNDSFIFPLHGTVQDMIADLETGSFTGLSEQGERKAKTRHLCSFCLSFDVSVVTQKVFYDFWKNYSPQIDRRYTIKAGEISLSQSLLNKGIEPTVIYDRTKLLQAFSNADPKAFDGIITALGHIDALTLSEQASLRKLDAKEQREALLPYLQTTENLRLSPIYSLLLHMPFIKRRNLKAYPKLSAWYADNLNLKRLFV